jgi:hypothetical protein
MVEEIGYLVLSFVALAIVGLFVKLLAYALDAVTKNDD